MAALLKQPRLLDVCGATSALAYLGLALASQTPPVSLAVFFACLGVAWAALLLAMSHACQSEAGLSLRRLIAWAVVFRLIGLAAQPILEDDHYRYVWDGRSFAVAGSPYLNAPADHFDDPSVTLEFQRVLDGINAPDVPTLYPPVAQLAFLASYAAAPAQLLPLKLILLIADLVTLLLLIRLLPLRGVLLYAWCPLLIQETAFTAHIDTLGVAFMVAAIHAATRGADHRSAAFAALALATKGLAILILPLLLPRLRWSAWLVFAATLALVYLPFLLQGGATELEGLRRFSAAWEFNSTGYALVAMLGGSGLAKFALATAVGGLTLILLRRQWASSERGIPRGELIFGCFFLFAPVVNPWYLLWLLPFAAARPAPWKIAALAVVSLSYAHGLFLPDSGLPSYHHPAWVRVAELVVVLLALMMSPQLARWRRSVLDSSGAGEGATRAAAREVARAG